MKKILIIEDNPEISDLLQDLLRKQGYEALVCPDAYQGINFTHKLKPDLILLDLMLPAGGGFSVLQNLKLSVLTSGIPVIVLTASRDSEHKKKALDLGVAAFMEKPFESAQLLAAVRQALGEGSAGSL